MPTSPSDPLETVLIAPFRPALEIGALTGAAGLTVGGVTGLFTSAHPTLFATLAGLQCFFLGTSFFYTRGALISGLTTKGHQSHELAASGVAGVLSGAAAGALRSRSNIIPGAIVIGITGLVGQAGFHAIGDHDDSDQGKKSLLSRLSERRWAPLRSLSDADYEAMLSEKLIKLEAELSIVDDQIAQLKQDRTKNAAVSNKR